MVKSDKSPANSFVASARRIYNPIGFAKGYNFVLWFIFDGALLGFTLARFMYLNYNGQFCADRQANSAAPGECFFYKQGHYRIGMMLHLFTIMPASLLVVFQFVPVIRHKARLFHRINGYIVLVLTTTSIIGALMIARHAFGGALATQALVGFLAIISITSLALAYYNVKRLQIDQHRAWMLRAWFYIASIITLRIIMILSALVVTSQKNYYTARPCAQLAYIYKGSVAQTTALYPDCQAYFNGSNLDQHVVVHAQMKRPEETGAVLGEGFSMAGWLALAIHAVGIEIYLKLTPRENERLRQVSYERQLERGFKHPGSAGLTVDRIGDADRWMPVKNMERDT